MTLKDVIPVFYSEIIFLIVAWILFLFVERYRTILLVGLIAGQASLYFLDKPFFALGYELPFYALPAINGIVLLLFYFAFASEKWAPKELDVEEFDR